MALRVDMDQLYEPNGPIPRSMESIVDMSDIPNLAKVDVSVLGCIKELVQYIKYGDVNSGVAFVLFASFGIMIPCMDMLVLFATTLFQFFFQKESKFGMTLNYI